MNDRFRPHAERAIGRDKQGLPAPPYVESDEELLLEDVNVVASTMECTGLMPTPPATPEEAESYSDLYPVPEVEIQVDNGLQQKKGVNPPQTP